MIKIEYRLHESSLNSNERREIFIYIDKMYMSNIYIHS